MDGGRRDCHELGWGVEGMEGTFREDHEVFIVWDTMLEVLVGHGAVDEWKE